MVHPEAQLCTNQEEAVERGAALSPHRHHPFRVQHQRLDYDVVTHDMCWLWPSDWGDNSEQATGRLVSLVEGERLPCWACLWCSARHHQQQLWALHAHGRAPCRAEQGHLQSLLLLDWEPARPEWEPLPAGKQALRRKGKPEKAGEN